MTNINADVVVVGAGVAGLMITKKLAGLGFKVALLEREKVVASGPSTRNEGWLHRGTYHAMSIRDRSAAIQVAKRCIYGHEQIRAYAPEAVEESLSRSFAILRDERRIQELRDRWDEAGVSYRPIAREEFHRIEPAVVLRDYAGVYEVQDVSIDTRILYRRLLNDIILSGSLILTDVHIKEIVDHTLFFSASGVQHQVTAECSSIQPALEYRIHFAHCTW